MKLMTTKTHTMSTNSEKKRKVYHPFVGTTRSNLKQVSVIVQIFWVIILMIFCVNELFTNNSKQLRKKHSLSIKNKNKSKRKVNLKEVNG